MPDSGSESFGLANMHVQSMYVTMLVLEDFTYAYLPL